MRQGLTANIDAIIDNIINPAPTAIPIAAVAQIPAAVVNP